MHHELQDLGVILTDVYVLRPGIPALLQLSGIENDLSCGLWHPAARGEVDFPAVEFEYLVFRVEVDRNQDRKTILIVVTTF